MLPVTGKPLIQYAREKAVISGIETVALVVRNHISEIRTHFSKDAELESLLENRKLTAVLTLVR
jgi:UTP-glucose-1-phosphate uridylyltransferase